MPSSLLSLHRHIGAVTLALLLGSAAWAQTPDQPSSAPDRTKLRQPTPSSVQQQADTQDAAEKSQTEIDRKLREMDRRLDRTLRSVCSGC
jgi:TolA-binding protein